MADRKALREKHFSEMSSQDRSAFEYISHLIMQIYKEVDAVSDLDKFSSNLRDKCGLDLLGEEKHACTLDGVILDLETLRAAVTTFRMGYDNLRKYTDNRKNKDNQ